MGVSSILSLALQAVQAGFALSEIVATVRSMEASGTPEETIHTYLRSLAHTNQTRLDNA